MEPGIKISFRHYRHLDFITASFVAVMIISNIAATKVVALGPFAFDGGTLLFPLSYIFGDILTEVYGYARSRRVIWTGFFWCAIAAAVLALIDIMPPAADWPLQESFHAILGQSPRIITASLIAFWTGEFTNSYILAKMKVLTNGRHLWMRTIGSTLAGETVDTMLFIAVAFLGVYPLSLLWLMFISNVAVKIGIEVIFTPATYRIVRRLKETENEDHYDRETNFNPFRFS